MCCGRTPWETFKAGQEIVKSKTINQNLGGSEASPGPARSNLVGSAPMPLEGGSGRIFLKKEVLQNRNDMV